MKTIALFAAVMVAVVARSEVRVGIIGCDTSHTIAFTKLMNVEKRDFTEGFRVTVAYQWGSRDIKECTDRYESYLPQLREMGVEIVPSISDLLAKCDVVCLETCDGRPHLEQAKEVFRSGKRVFIDKPIAEDYAHARLIYEAGKESGARYFSSSALRYADEQQACRKGVYGKIAGCDYFAPSPIAPAGTHSRYVWYGIHGFEPIFAVMGSGVASVRTVSCEGVDIIVMIWTDGRVATLRASANRWTYGGNAHTEKGETVKLGGYEGYEKLLRQIIAFFRTGVVPVPNEETLEMFAVMEAAAKSRDEGGRCVAVSEITGAK